jgi:hypothetical protein
MPIPILGPVASFIVANGAREAARKYAPKVIKKAQEEIKKRESAIDKAASQKSKTDKNPEFKELHGKTFRKSKDTGRGMTRMIDRSDKKSDIFREPTPDRPLKLAEGGSLMMPEEGMPVDTYPNIPPDEMAEVEASQLPDDEMEEDYLDYVVDESLDNEEQDYLMNALEADPKLSQIFDKVIDTASEFSGAGEVEGPGTGVSDSIPARLSDGEFVITKKATDAIGADNLQAMMDEAERADDSGQKLRLAFGGMAEKEDELEDSKDYLSRTDEEIKKVMIGSNRMPSVR